MELEPCPGCGANFPDQPGPVHAHVRRLLRAALAQTGDFPRLERTSGPGELTVLHMTGMSDLGDYERRARAWAVEVWRTWEGEHDTIHAYHRGAWP